MRLSFSFWTLSRIPRIQHIFSRRYVKHTTKVTSQILWLQKLSWSIDQTDHTTFFRPATWSNSGKGFINVYILMCLLNICWVTKQLDTKRLASSAEKWPAAAPPPSVSLRRLDHHFAENRSPFIRPLAAEMLAWPFRPPFLRLTGHCLDRHFRF